VVWSIGLMYLVGSELNFLSVLIPTILFIIGTSDCVHILSQYQDCRYICTSKQEAVQTTLRLMFVPCLLTTLTTMICLLSLQFSHVEAFRLFGLFTAAGVGFTFLLSITLLPIGLAMGDTKTLSVRKSRSEAFLGILHGLNRMTSSYKRPVLILSVLALSMGIHGFTKLHVETDAIKVFGKNFKGVSDTIYISKEVGGVIPLYVMVDSQEEDGIKDPSLLRKIEALTEFLVLQDGVDKVVSASDLVKYMNYRFHESDPAFYRLPDDRHEVAQLLLMASLSDDSGTLRRFFDDLYRTTPIGIRYSHTDLMSIQGINNRIREYLQHHFDGSSSVRAYTTGTAILWANTVVPIRKALGQSLVLASVLLFALMVFMFRSVMVGVISMVPNLIPIVMTLGTMGLLDISLNLGTAPVAAIALGIAIDDTIHFLSRFRMELHRDRDYPGAIQRTIRSVGKPILITSFILTVGFFIFLFSNFQFTQNMGVLISLTVISAIFGDLVLLPILLLIFKPIKG
jgi:predicted RND superfamily exporter protein